MAYLKHHHGDWLIDVLTTRRLYRGSPNEALPKAEVWQGIRIKRLSSLRSGCDSFLRRAFSDLLFSIRAAIRVVVSCHDVIVLVTNPPLMPLLVALLGTLRRQRLLYIIHDLYPDVPVALGLWRADSLFVRFLIKLQKFALRKAQRVVVLGRCMREHLINAYGIESGKIEVIPNWATLPTEEPASKQARSGRHSTLVYGNLGQFHDFQISNGAELWDSPFIRFYIVGDGARANWLHEEVAREANVTLRSFLQIWSSVSCYLMRTLVL